MQPSSAKVRTSSSGVLVPTRPSVEPKVSATGTPKPARMVARRCGVRVSLVQVTTDGVIRSRPICRSCASRACIVG
jgi:hypothetical protein